MNARSRSSGLPPGAACLESSLVPRIASIALRTTSVYSPSLSPKW